MREVGSDCARVGRIEGQCIVELKYRVALPALFNCCQASRQALRSLRGSTPAGPFHNGITSAGRGTVSTTRAPAPLR